MFNKLKTLIFIYFDLFKAYYNKYLIYSMFVKPPSNQFNNLRSLFKAKSFFIYEKTDKKDFINLFGNNSFKNVNASADKILQNQFTILNKIDIDAGTNLNWDEDYLNDFKFPQKYYRFVQLKNPSLLFDPKIPWELSRFHQGVVLAQVYTLTREEKYAEKTISLFSDWCRKNPWKFGINWTCAMEVAIRISNIIFAFGMIQDSKAVKSIKKKSFNRIVQQHLDFIWKNLEWSEKLTTNHYIADLMGLIAIGVFFPDLKNATEAKAFAFAEVEKEMFKQFYEDGGNFESSTTYHRFVCEMLFLILYLAEKDSFRFTNKFYIRMKKAVNLVNNLASSIGNIPQIGDNDSGRIIPFKQRQDNDVRHLGALFGILLDDPALVIPDWGFPEEVYWFFGEDGYRKYISLVKTSPKRNINSIAFSDTGLYVMRSQDAQMVISACPNGQNGHGGHCHNDKLSFTLTLDDHDIIVDPGTYVYSGNLDLRHRFRSTKSHNTVMVDNEEQNRFIDNALFWVEPDAKSIVNKWTVNRGFDVFEGEHSGYKRLAGDICHRRAIYFDKRNLFWMIVDDITETNKTDQTRMMKLSFQFASHEVEEINSFSFPNELLATVDHLPFEKKIAAENISGFKVKVTDRQTLYILISALPSWERLFKKNWISDSYCSKYEGVSVGCKINGQLPLRLHSFLWIVKNDSTK